MQYKYCIILRNMGKTSQESRLLVDAPFGNALAGYFRAETDPNWKQHSLGTLATATHQRGKRDGATVAEAVLLGVDRGIVAYRYRPTWGAGTEVSVIGMRNRGDLVLSGLALVHANVAPVHIICRGPEPGAEDGQRVMNALVLTDLVGQSRQDLLKDPIAARDYVSEQARHFFSTVASSLGVERLLLEAPTLPQ